MGKKNLGSGLLCGCLLTIPPSLAPQARDDSTWCDLDILEWRLDSLLQDVAPEYWFQVMSDLAAAIDLPVIATCRSEQQGGYFSGSHSKRANILDLARRAGARWIDLEFGLDTALIKPLKAKGAEIVLSYHNFSETPSSGILRGLLKSMVEEGADIAKIVTYANKEADGLDVLDLILYGIEEFNIPVIAFCMGEKGRWTRIMCVLLGSPWTYVKLPGAREAAPGQFSISDARTIIRLLKGEHNARRD